jgi:tripartite-type tricarboxylate transporter receptor subunit TctC
VALGEIRAAGDRTLHDALKKGQEEPAYLAVLAAFGQEPHYLNSDDYRAFAIRETAEQKRLIEALGLKRD